MEKKSLFSYKSDYEKEIYSQVLPIARIEIEDWIRSFCDFPHIENVVNIPGYNLGGNSDNILVFYMKDKTNFGKLNVDDNDNFIDMDLLFIPPENKPFCLGCVEVKELVEGIKIPIQIRIFSYHQEMDLWWARLTEVIKKRVEIIMPDFVSTPESDISSQSSMIEDKQWSDNITVPKSHAVREKWKRVWDHIKDWRDNNWSYSKISNMLEEDQDDTFRFLPHDRNTLSKIEKAGRAGKLGGKKVQQ
jgi:hypothetical protein